MKNDAREVVAMMNIRLDIEYDGEPFCGWQRQREGVPTIQAAIEDAISRVVGRNTVVYGAGRTDSGVHARCQVANFDVECDIPPDRWGLVLNTKLDKHIRVLRSLRVPDDFHSQKHALSKVYEYRVLNRNHASALDRRVYFLPQSLDWAKMAEAAQFFVGTKDFKAFQATNGVTKTTVRTIYRFDLGHDTAVPGLYRFVVQGNGFLKQMVRNMVGTLLEVGEGRQPPQYIEQVLASRQRDEAGRTVPARGLYLMEIEYPERMSVPFIPDVNPA